MQPAPLTGTATPCSWRSSCRRTHGMQPAPLAGTATSYELISESSTLDATRTPYGDGNCLYRSVTSSATSPRCTPYGDGNILLRRVLQLLDLDATRTPYGDGNARRGAIEDNCARMDATRTPYGDGNLRILDLHLVAGRCNPHPLRGRQLIEPFILEFDPPMQPAPLAGTVTRSK